MSQPAAVALLLLVYIVLGAVTAGLTVRFGLERREPDDVVLWGLMWPFVWVLAVLYAVCLPFRAVYRVVAGQRE